MLLVVGSPASSNSNRLREIAEKAGIPGYLVDGADDLQPRMVRGQARGGRDGGGFGARDPGAAA